MPYGQGRVARRNSCRRFTVRLGPLTRLLSATDLYGNTEQLTWARFGSFFSFEPLEPRVARGQDQGSPLAPSTAFQCDGVVDPPGNAKKADRRARGACPHASHDVTG